jgi:Lrp/AsnC family transcriptional regulator, leucine-responsive regulatory protein
MAPPLLDRIDLKLLSLLQEDAARPVSALAEAVGLSSPACYRRIRTLRRAGFIRREVAVVSRRTMGWPLMMIVLVRLESEQAQSIDQLFQILRRTAEVIEAHYVTGDYDFLLKVIARDMDGFETLMRQTLYSSGIVKTYKTLVVMREVKEASPIPPSGRAE